MKFKKEWKKCDDPMHFIATVLRYAFGIMFLLVAVKKLRMGYGGFAESLVAADTLFANEVPDFFLYVYGWLIPAAELIAGIFLLINRKVKFAYKLIAFMYLTFILGQQYNGDTAKVGNEYLPALVALSLAYFSHDKNGGK